jgi:hypothetical protein
LCPILKRRKALTYRFKRKGRAIVGHDAVDGDAVAAEKPQGVEQEAQTGAALLVGQDFRAGLPRMIVDGEMQMLPADARLLLRPVRSPVIRCPVRSKRPSF